MFRGACWTWLESSSSLHSHQTNGLSFGLSNKKLWQINRDYSGGQQSRETTSEMYYEGTFYTPYF